MILITSQFNIKYTIRYPQLFFFYLKLFSQFSYTIGYYLCARHRTAHQISKRFEVPETKEEKEYTPLHKNHFRKKKNGRNYYFLSPSRNSAGTLWSKVARTSAALRYFTRTGTEQSFHSASHHIQPSAEQVLPDTGQVRSDLVIQ